MLAAALLRRCASGLKGGATGAAIAEAQVRSSGCQQASSQSVWLHSRCRSNKVERLAGRGQTSYRCTDPMVCRAGTGMFMYPFVSSCAGQTSWVLYTDLLSLPCACSQLRTRMSTASSPTAKGISRYECDWCSVTNLAVVTKTLDSVGFTVFLCYAVAKAAQRLP